MKNFVFLSLISFIQRRTPIFLLRDNSLNFAEKETPKFKVPNPNCEILLSLYRNPRLDPQVEPADGMIHNGGICSSFMFFLMFTSFFAYKLPNKNCNCKRLLRWLNLCKFCTSMKNWVQSLEPTVEGENWWLSQPVPMCKPAHTHHNHIYMRCSIILCG